MMTVVPDCLAKRVSWAAHSLTCATDPGAEVRASEYRVWMESITATSGLISRSVPRIFSSWISACSCRFGASRPSRFARRATCEPDSSPLTYRTFLEWARLTSVCSRSVDFPIPGSPPISTTPPGTSPPPSTRSNSPMPELKRGTSIASISDSDSTGAVWAMPCRLVEKRFDEVGSTTVSTSVFHWPQAGHFPAHLLLTPPHSVQVYWIFAFAMSRAVHNGVTSIPRSSVAETGRT